jgi:hypothetical protein
MNTVKTNFPFHTPYPSIKFFLFASCQIENDLPTYSLFSQKIVTLDEFKQQETTTD